LRFNGRKVRFIVHAVTLSISGALPRSPSSDLPTTQSDFRKNRCSPWRARAGRVCFGLLNTAISTRRKKFERDRAVSGSRSDQTPWVSGQAEIRPTQGVWRWRNKGLDPPHGTVIVIILGIVG
jgi:hypothetical protein